jgi:integrase
MPKRTLNDRIIKSLKPATSGRYEIMDTVVPGFGIRVTERGVKTFILVARYPGSAGNPVRRSLGEFGELTLEAARAKARHWHELIRRGIDPAEDEERQRLAVQHKRKNTFGAVAEDFIADKLPTERKGQDVEQDIRRDLIPAWGDRPIVDITPLDVRALVRSIKERGFYQAHNTLTTLRRMFGWAIDQQVYDLQMSPCDRLKPKVLIGEKQPRQRILSPAELRGFWQACGALGYPYGPLLRVLALTGARKSEIAGTAWPEVDVERKLLTIPPARAKVNAAHVIPLSDAVIEILNGLPRFKSGSYLFSTTSGAKPPNAFSHAKDDLDREMAKVLGAPVERFVIHDIRRTVRTGLSAIPGISDLVRELVIGHTKPGLHKVYDQHAYLDEKRHALDAWAARLRDIVAPPPSNVTRLRRAQP